MGHPPAKWFIVMAALGRIEHPSRLFQLGRTKLSCQQHAPQFIEQKNGHPPARTFPILLCRKNYGAHVRRSLYWSFPTRFPVHSTCCILLGTSIFLNFSGIAASRCGMCMSPRTSTSSPKSPAMTFHQLDLSKSLQSCTCDASGRPQITSTVRGMVEFIQWADGSGPASILVLETYLEV